MNYKYPYAVFALFFLITLSNCKFSDNQNDNSVSKLFSRSDFKLKNTIAEEIPFNKSLNPMTLNVVADSLLLVINWNTPEYYGELYSMKDLSLVTRFAKRGKGPGEYLSSYFVYKTLHKRSFILIDITKGKGSIYNIDSLYIIKENYTPRMFNINPNSNNDLEVVGQKVITFNKFYVSDLKYRNKIEPLLSYNLSEGNDFSSIYSNCKHHTYNVTGAFVAAHPTRDIIWLIYQNENRIEIYNKNLRLQKSLTGPETFVPEYEVINVFGSEILTFKKSTDTFWKCFYTMNHLYIIYFGEINEERENPLCVLKFTWEGDPVQLYEINKKIRTLYIDSKEKYMYGTHIPRGEYPTLLRYKL